MAGGAGNTLQPLATATSELLSETAKLAFLYFFLSKPTH
jgi:hypothetical protein